MQDKIEPTASEQAAWHAGLDEGHEWLEEADEPGQESSFPVYAAPVLAAQQGGAA